MIWLIVFLIGFQNIGKGGSLVCLMAGASLLTVYRSMMIFDTMTKKKKKTFENVVGKGENAANQHFLLFLQRFIPFQKKIAPFERK